MKMWDPLFKKYEEFQHGRSILLKQAQGPSQSEVLRTSTSWKLGVTVPIFHMGTLRHREAMPCSWSESSDPEC